MFIKEYISEDTEWCDLAVEFCHNNLDHFVEGKCGQGDINKDIKDSLDISLPSSSDLPWIETYTKKFRKYIDDYVKEFQITDYCGDLKLEKNYFHYQYYKPGGGFKTWHAEAGAPWYANRVLTWITFLNNIKEGGGTSFLHQNTTVKPKKGKTAVFPGSFTHVHRGEIAPNEEKHIITGWIVFNCDWPEGKDF